MAGEVYPPDLEWDTLPCGCQIASKDGVMYLKPHDLYCKYYAYATQEAHRVGKPVEFRISD